MRFVLYAGGVEHAYSPVGGGKVDKNLLEAYQALPKLPCLPLFSDKKMISELYQDNGFAFTEDRYHVFSVVCTQPKFDNAIATNLLFALVPEQQTFGNRKDKETFSGKLQAYNLDRLATLHNTGIKFNVNTQSNRQFVKLLLAEVAKRIKPINKLLNKKKVMFDMVSVDPKTATVQKPTEKVKGVELIYNLQGNQHSLRTESEVIGVGHYINFNLALKCDEEAVRELGTLPTFFLEKHVVFSKFKEMIWGVDKKENDSAELDEKTKSVSAGGQ